MYNVVVTVIFHKSTAPKCVFIVGELHKLRPNRVTNKRDVER